MIEESGLQGSDDGVLVKRGLEVNEIAEVAQLALLGVVGRRCAFTTSVRSRLVRRGSRSNSTPTERSALDSGWQDSDGRMSVSVGDNGRRGSHGQLCERAGVIAASGK